MKRASIYLIFGVLVATASPVLADDAEYQKVRDGLSKLAPLIGKWNAVWTFHQGDGVTRELGTTSITSVLGDTYLQLAVERHNEADPKRSLRHVSTAQRRRAGLLFPSLRVQADHNEPYLQREPPRSRRRQRLRPQMTGPDFRLYRRGVTSRVGGFCGGR